MDNLNPMTCVMNVPILVLIVKITNITVLFVLLIESKLLIVIVLPGILITVMNNLNVKFVIINVLLVFEGGNLPSTQVTQLSASPTQVAHL
jgi:hypothetical protein